MFNIIDIAMAVSTLLIRVHSDNDICCIRIPSAHKNSIIHSATGLFVLLGAIYIFLNSACRTRYSKLSHNEFY